MKTKRLQRLIGVGAIATPLAHTLTDMVGLYAVQRPKIGALGLTGSLLYGASFIYFAHTTLVAIAEQIPNYETLWNRPQSDAIAC